MEAKRTVNSKGTLRIARCAALGTLFLCAAPATAERGGADGVLSAMTVEQKVGQMFFLSLRGKEDESGQVQKHYTLTDEDRALLQNVMPGGVVLFGENVESDEQVRRFIAGIKSALLQTHMVRYAPSAHSPTKEKTRSTKQCQILPFISVDQEGGRVQRIRHSDTLSAATLPPMLTVGEGVSLAGGGGMPPATGGGKARDALRVGQTIGGDLAALGFNMDFAPVCDVFSNPNNTVIGDRAFSRNPRAAAVMSVAASKGMRGCGIIPVAKHFPGHGDTQKDSHAGQVILDKSLAQLNKTELVPFRRQIRSGAEAVMVAHITLPQFDDAPATLSRAIVTDLLRGRLGFKGVVITDAMGMKAVTLLYSNDEAAVLAVKAGCDMLLMCEDPQSACRAVISAVKQGDISTARIDESVRRILRLKAKYGIVTPQHKNAPDDL